MYRDNRKIKGRIEAKVDQEKIMNALTKYYWKRTPEQLKEATESSELWGVMNASTSDRNR